MKELDDITGEIIDAALKIHQGLGPGLLEAVYESVLAKSLEKRGLKVERQKPITFVYDEIAFDDGFRIDLLVADRVVVELKSVEKLAPVHSKQLLTYIRLMNLPVGLLLNFGAATLKRRSSSHCERPPILRVSATPREPNVRLALRRRRFRSGISRSVLSSATSILPASLRY